MQSFPVLLWGKTSRALLYGMALVLATTFFAGEACPTVKALGLMAVLAAPWLLWLDYRTPPRALYSHRVRGGLYVIEAGAAELQVSSGPLAEGDRLVIYRDRDGKVWARKDSEFHDGRFALVGWED